MRIFLGFVIGFIWSSQVWAKNVIYWQTYHVPPISIQSGEHFRSGFVDRMLNMIIQRMPEYDHEHPLTAHTRALENMKAGKPVCHPALFVTEERKAFAHFSVPSMISPSIRLIGTEENLTVLGHPGRVDLHEVLSNPDYAFGLINRRSFGEEIDSTLAKFDQDRFILSSAEETQKLLMLISSGRLHYSLAYPFEVGFFKQDGQGQSTLSSANIKGIESFVLGSVACSKNPWGKKVIEKVDKVLLEIRNSEEYLDAMTTWWEDERQKQEFQQFLQNHFAVN